MEETLFVSRTHPKVLLKIIVIQIFLFALHAGLIWLWHRYESWSEYRWVGYILHGVIIVVSLWYVVVPLLKWWNKKYTLTNKRVISEWGVLYKHSREIDLTRIASISEARGILDRLFGAGTLNFYDASAPAQPETSGAWNQAATDLGVKFNDIPKVKRVRQLIETAKYDAQHPE